MFLALLVAATIQTREIKVSAYVTKYNTSGTMANGQQTYVGAVACPREIKLGTKVMIDSKLYTCTDRTAKWVEKKWPNTFDIYSTGTTKELLKFGRKKKEVIIIKNY